MSSWVFIDSRVQDAEVLLAGVAEDAQVVMLEAGADGIEQILLALHGADDLDSIHIVSHGASGTLVLGATVLDEEALDDYGDELAAIGASLADDGDLLLYGCDVGAGAAGANFLDALARRTGADVAASSNATGSTRLGGDWTLEVSTGAIGEMAPFDAGALESYPHVLATVSDVVTPQLSSHVHIDSLIDIGPGWNWLTPARTNIVYTFSIASGIENSNAQITGGITAFNAAQQAATVAQLNHVTQLTGITFVETATGTAADVHFANTNIVSNFVTGLCSYSWGYSSNASNTITSYTADAWVYLDNVEWAASNTNPTAGSVGYETLLHEIGHAMGLKHPFSGSPTLPAAQDNTANTVMSYTHAGGNHDTFSPYDVAALRWIYGGDGLGGARGVGASGKYLVGTSAANSLSTGAGNDVLDGMQGNDSLNGGAGNDTLMGGTGTDTAVYNGARNTFTITSLGSAWSVVDGNAAANGNEGTDELSGMEFVQFSDQTVDLANVNVDSAPPAVASLSPLDEATNAPVAGNIVVTFSEAIQRGAGNIVLKTVGGATIETYNAATSTNLSISGTTLTINPTTNLSHSTGYRVEFASGTIKDMAANNYAGTTSYNFTTVAAPVVIPTLSIAAATASQPEGNSGTTNFTFTVTRSDDSSGTSAANWTVTSASALGADFAGGVLPSGSVSFAAGETFRSIVVPVVGDTAVEANETFTVTLSSPTGATLGTKVANGTIVNDDTVVVPALSIAATGADKAEGNSGSTPFTFTVTRSGDVSLGTTVNWELGAGASPEVGIADFGGTFPGGVLAFAAGATSALISVAVTGDTLYESNGVAENFVVTLFNASGVAAIVAATATGRIQNDDPAPPATLAIAAASADKVEGNGGVTPFTFTVTRGGNTGGSTTVNWALSTGTNPAVDETDLAGGILPGGQLTFTPAETSKTITINVSGDTAFESGGASENFVVTLSNGSGGATITEASAAGRIQNDDASPAPTLAIAATSADKAEGNNGVTPYTFTVTRFGGATGSATVNWAVSAGTNPATDATDFDGGFPGGTLSFAAGELTKTITVNVSGDTLYESGGAEENFVVTLAGANGAAITAATAEGHIQNDDEETSEIVGTSGDDVLSGTDDDDEMNALAGNDELYGGRGNDTLDGGMGNDYLRGDTLLNGSKMNEVGSGADSLIGGEGDDSLQGGAGNDVIDGSAGVDTAVFAGNRAAYVIGDAGASVSAPGDSDTLTGIERIEFADKRFAYDLGLEQAPGIAVRIMGAAFDAGQIVANPTLLGDWIELLEAGTTRPQLCAIALSRPEYLDLDPVKQSSAPGTSSHVGFVNAVYFNVVGVLPPAADRDYYAGLLQDGTWTQAGLLEFAASHPANELNIDITGLQARGVEFA